MKKIVVIGAVFLAAMSFSFAQTQKEIIKERKAISKLSKSELEAKASKEARKEAKQLKKEGWMKTPGALPIEKQLDKSYKMQYEYDEQLRPKYIMGEAMSVGSHYDAAKMQAIELSKQTIAEQVQTEIHAFIENTVANKQLANEDAVSITESLIASTNAIVQSMGQVVPIVEVYRTKSGKNKEVLVRIAYNSDMAKEITKKTIRQNLEEKGNKLHERLDQALGW
ncbi:MAG: hypothetical protein LBQ28_06080 [Prevotellaceae bacterium]|jgi:hypothetical protein|nr:hypothetical protein [Prevotellaceae bacterium]